MLVIGLNGNEDGFYEFDGYVNSYIDFLNNGGLDVQCFIIVLCWLYFKIIGKGLIFSYGINDQQWIVYFWLLCLGELRVIYMDRNYLDILFFKIDSFLLSN